MDIWGGISGTIYIFDQRYFNILWGLTSTDAYFRRGKFGFCSAFVLAPLYNVRKINGARPFSSRHLLRTKTYFVQSLSYFLHHTESKTPCIEYTSLNHPLQYPVPNWMLWWKFYKQASSICYILGNLPEVSVCNLIFWISQFAWAHLNIVSSLKTLLSKYPPPPSPISYPPKPLSSQTPLSSLPVAEGNTLSHNYCQWGDDDRCGHLF